MSVVATAKPAPRLKKKHRSKDDLAKSDNVPQVHQTIKKEAPSVRNHQDDTRSETTTQSGEFNQEAEDSSNESNRTFVLEDQQNENNQNHHHMKAISRDISVDTGGQINSKIEKGIIGLIESEIIKEKSKYSHFSDSRPQSLSFYEDDNPPDEELTGNLQPLSPDEKRHYRKRFDQEDNEVVLDLQESELREKDQRQGLSSKKSKSRRKKHGSGDPEPGMGDSTEIILPKEKRKSKKSKKRDYSPSMSNSGRKKYKKKPYGADDAGNDVIVSLEDLQDDVFERERGDGGGKFRNYQSYNTESGLGGGGDRNSQSKSPRHNNGETQKIYFQKRNKFELGTNSEGNPVKMNETQPCDYLCDEDDLRLCDDALIIAICCQRWWSRCCMFFHGLFGGVAFAHLLLVLTSQQIMEHFVLYYYSDFAECYVILFYILNVLCLVAVFDRYDVAHINASHLRDLFRYHKASITIILYSACLIIHLITVGKYDLLLVKVGDAHKKILNQSFDDLSIPEDAYEGWYSWTIWRDLLAVLCWLIISFLGMDNFLHLHLRNMVKYIVNIDSRRY